MDPMTVVIIDDNLENRCLLTTVLEGAGYHVVQASNGEEALLHIIMDVPTLIISDILMPVMDGYQLCRHCKEDATLKHVPFVFYTATFTNPQDELFAYSLGADGFLLKPMEPDRFLRAIQEIVHLAASKTVTAHKSLPGQDVVVLKQYNEALIRKLEDKMSQTVHNEKQLVLLLSAMSHTTDGIIITDASALDERGPRIVFVNEAFTKMTGYAPEDVIGQSPRILQGPRTDQNELNKLIQVLKKNIPTSVTILGYNKSGDEYWSRISVSPVFDATGNVSNYVGIIRDATEQKKRALQRDLLQLVSAIFKQSINISNALNQVCTEVVRFGEFSFAEIWLPNVHETALVKIASAAGDANGAEFLKASLDRTEFCRGDGLPGFVWQNGVEVMWADVDGHKQFVRKQAAHEAGIAYTIGIPLFCSTRFMGVLVVGATDDKIKFYTIVFSRLATFVGEEISRKQIEDRFRSLVDSIPGLMCTMTLDGTILQVNSAGCDMLGYQEDETVGQSIYRFVHPDDSPSFAHTVSNLNHDSARLQVKNRCVTRSGEVHWLAWTGLYSGENGVLYASAYDITDVMQSEEWLRAILDVLPVGICIIDRSYRLEYLNPELKRLFGNAEKGLCFEYLHNRDSPCPWCTNEPIFQGTRFRCHWRAPNGRYVGWYDAPFRNADGSMSKLGVITDVTDMHEGHMAAQRTRDFMRVASHIARLGAWEMSVPDAKMTWSDEVYRIHGIAPGSVVSIGDGVNFYAPEHREVFKEAFDACIREGVPYDIELKIVSIDGTMKWVRTIGEAVRDDEGHVVKVQGAFQDIDEQKRAVEHLFRERYYSSTLIDSLPGIFFLFDEKGQFISWNEYLECVTGYTHQEIESAHPIDFFQGVDKDLISGCIEQAFSEGKASTEAVLIAKNGAGIPYWFTGRRIEFNDRPCIIVMGIDITARKAAERVLLDLSAAVNASGDVVFMTDLDGTITSVNARFTELYGYTAEEVVGKVTPRILRSSQHDRDFYRQFWDSIRNGENRLIEVMNITKDGRLVPIEGAVTPFRGDDGNVAGFMAIQRDISERKRATTELVRLNEAMGVKMRELEMAYHDLEQFAFVASHDLQEPLRMVSSFMELLRSKYSSQLDENAMKYIHFATDGASRMRSIILDLLEYSRAGKDIGPALSIDLGELVAEYKLLRRMLISEKNVTLKIAKLPVAKGYHAPLSQVIHCLLDNAIKYSAPGVDPVVKISCTKTADECIVSICDNGIGIEAQYFDKIFAIFQRLHNRDEYEGTGIGLAIVKKHVQSWGGRVWVESTPGKGSCFYFTLPH